MFSLMTGFQKETEDYNKISSNLIGEHLKTKKVNIKRNNFKEIAKKLSICLGMTRTFIQKTSRILKTTVDKIINMNMKKARVRKIVGRT